MSSRRTSITVHADVVAQIRERLAAAGGRTAPPVSFVVFGGSGDLAHRKIFPALYNLAADGLLPEKLTVVGVARNDMTDDAFRDEMAKAVTEFSRRPPDGAVWGRLASAMRFVGGDFGDPSTFARLRGVLDESDATRGTGSNRIFYFATPPSAFAGLLAWIREGGLVHPVPPAGAPAGPFSRVIIEKPFGRDLSSARELNALTAAHLDESQVYRIDHYLGKETVQNLLVLRFANAIFEPIWNRKYVDHVQITAAEEVGVGHRAGYYEEAGALRDMVQSHLLQVMAMVAMEPPVSSSADAVRDQTAAVLGSLHPMTGECVARDAVRAQYAAFRGEPGVKPGSRTPTFVALRAGIDNWRWKGVPFFVRTGKAMSRRVTEVAVFFQEVPLSLFGRGNAARPEPNILVIRIQPDEGVGLHLAAKMPGDEIVPTDVLMDFRYSQAFDRQPPEAYERLIHDCMLGDATLFARRDAVEAAWGWVTPILERWAEEDATAGGAPIPVYPGGSWGPAEADALIAEGGRAWRRPSGRPRDDGD